MKVGQSVSVGIGVMCAVLALFTATGHPVIAAGGPEQAPVFLLLVTGLGAGCGLLAGVRARAVEKTLWEIVDDSALTSGERELAHREAVSEKKVAAVMYLVGPLGVGLMLAYQLKGETIGAAELLMFAPLVGFGVGLGGGRWWTRAKEPLEL